ncbi:hypothetical protein BGZ76_005209 [Entomortierella beljakovae]|nr:hypothetical protein BGZ76_005209 [Entomortierella beljakovae]
MKIKVTIKKSSTKDAESVRKLRMVSPRSMKWTIGDFAPKDETLIEDNLVPQVQTIPRPRFPPEVTVQILSHVPRYCTNLQKVDPSLWRIAVRDRELKVLKPFGFTSTFLEILDLIE